MPYSTSLPPAFWRSEDTSWERVLLDDKAPLESRVLSYTIFDGGEVSVQALTDVYLSDVASEAEIKRAVADLIKTDYLRRSAKGWVRSLAETDKDHGRLLACFYDCSDDNYGPWKHRETLARLWEKWEGTPGPSIDAAVEFFVSKGQVAINKIGYLRLIGWWDWRPE